MTKSIFYHAGCSVCLNAENEILELIGEDQIEIVHLGLDKSRLPEAESRGLKSVPALYTPKGSMLHINFGADIADLK